MHGELYAMHEPALLRFLEDAEAARVLVTEAPKAFWDDDEPDDDDDEPGYTVDDNGMATIPVTGPLMQSKPRYFAWFGINATAYPDILNALAKAQADPNVKAATLAMNTPGGEVHGVDLVWQAIRGFTKPISARNDGMIASAGYYAASAADHIWATAPSAETGSIGVVIAGYDDSKLGEKMGVKRVTIYSKNAPNKAADFSTEKGLQLIQDRADAFERIFHSRVAVGRGISAADVPEKFGAGGIFVAQDPDKTKPNALQMGLIDQVGGTWTPATEGPGSANFRLETKPASAGESPLEEKMNLTELLANSAEARAELAERLGKAKAEGRDEVLARAKAAAPYIGSDAYPKAISDLALKVITGEMSNDALVASVTVFDATKEKAAGEAAAGAQAEDTPSQTHATETAAFNAAKKKPDAVKAQADIDALIAADKGAV